ncbi:hypothetical protein QYF36_002326 [Acer negundo]|nr:hypothetical protein QYF36_002326 [Acer negundo]
MLVADDSECREAGGEASITGVRCWNGRRLLSSISIIPDHRLLSPSFQTVVVPLLLPLFISIIASIDDFVICNDVNKCFIVEQPSLAADIDSGLGLCDELVDCLRLLG